MGQIIDERDTGKSWYFAITEFSKCLIIRSPSLLFHEYLREAFIFTQERSQKGKKPGLISFTHEQKIIWSRTQFNDIVHEQIIFCWQLFAGHVMSSWRMKRKEKLHRMIVQCHLFSFNNSSDFKEKSKYRYFNHSPSSDSISRVFLTLTIRHLHISQVTSFFLGLIDIESKSQMHCCSFFRFNPMDLIVTRQSNQRAQSQQTVNKGFNPSSLGFFFVGQFPFFKKFAFS